MLDLMAKILRENDLDLGVYAEPYAGGAGLALGLLYGGHVAEIHINDIDPAIWSFWHSCLFQTEALAEMVMAAEFTIDEWRRQRAIFLEGECGDSLELGFSAFYLNRTNRSGIIKGAGVIGGLNQTGAYKMDCRFNKEDLVRRIRRVAKYKRRIHLSRLDAIDFLEMADEVLPKKSLLCIDPPYFNKGSSLYTSFYTPEDHEALSKKILGLSKNWVVTYDNAAEINALYDDCSRHTFDVSYSVQTKRVASELLISCDTLSLPHEIEERRIA